MHNHTAVKKKKIVFFRWRYSDLCADFVLANKRLTEQALKPFFEVVALDQDCDFSEVVETHEPDLVMFESGSGTLPFWRPKITNTNAYPEIPRIGLLESDPHSGSRSVFMTDMDRLGIETFFTRATSMGEYFPAIADRLFIWPWHADVTTYQDWGIEKHVILTLTGACSPPYPWREKLYPLLTGRYPTLRSIHGGYLRSQALTMKWGKEYSKMLNASLFSACCGTAWKLLVKKHFEISASGCCLVADDTPILAAAGFKDMTNCVLGDERDIPGKMDELLADPDRLANVTRAGVNLIHERHLPEHRPQIFQWLDLTQRHGSGVKMVQDGPFGDVRLMDGPKDTATPHLENFAEDRAILSRARELLSRGKHRPAAVLFRKVLDMAWHMPEANFGMALCDLYAGLPESARDRFRITLKWCMKQYKCHAPNPVEWAWYIVTQLCLGNMTKARHLAAQFSAEKGNDLRARDMEYVRALIKVLDGKTIQKHPREEACLPCIHESPFTSFSDFLTQVGRMFKACRQQAMSNRIRTALDEADNGK
ncbi:glycosyltransferase [Salidesulfovibrio onnuriiensis]|uniref:glycosyltransferase n=1 Tax=Salidesulfovibrio onnuriiensis TaxID=2583823 RepID=UPI0011C8E1C8|nr:glycosyltransferase [Salidesulfovibrio onnuriiensis]